MSGTSKHRARPAFPSAEPSFAHVLSAVAHTVCLRTWDKRDVDQELQRALVNALSLIKAVGIIAKFTEEHVCLPFLLPGCGIEAVRLDAVIEEIQQQASRAHIEFSLESEALSVAAAVMSSDSAIAKTDPTKRDWCALLFVDVPEKQTTRESLLGFHSRATVGVLFQVLRHRARLFLPFAPAVADRYWRDAFRPAETRLQPPWLATESLDTVTLSFDLRKSTFCMEHAVDAIRFARWIDQLVRILTRITHIHGGIFDKFTGDGVIAHFLVKECDAVGKRSAVVSALDCAISMQYAVMTHLPQLRKILVHDSDLLGGGIGIDAEPAQWDLDHRKNPVTVGRGVVNACRLGDKARAGTIRVTNIAYQILIEDLAKEPDKLASFKRLPFRQVPYSSKDYDAAMKLKVWELVGASRYIGSRQEIDDLRDEVYRTTPGATPPQH